tara:strand:+ start:1682 stop:2533 length:852 start_codon:yes stop_codon:yes gene_type:complete
VLYSASNAKLKVNGNEILASNAQLSLGTNLQPAYLITNRNTNEYSASDGVGGDLSFNYYLTGDDYFKSFITGQGERVGETTVISGNFGGLNFDSGYLTSYSVNFSPNTAAIASAQVTFFDELRGEFVESIEPPPSSVEVLNVRNAVVANAGDVFSSGDVSNFIGGAYNYNAEVKPVYLMNETKPSDVSFGPKSVNINFEIDTPSGYLPFSGTRAKILVSLKNSAGTTVENFVCSGVANQRGLASSAGDYIKQTINVLQGTAEEAAVSKEDGEPLDIDDMRGFS